MTRGNRFITPENDPEYKPETYDYTDAIGDKAERTLIYPRSQRRR